MDDFPRLLENVDFRTKGFAPFDPETLKNQVYLRPVTDAFNFTTFVFFGETPLGYHLLNLILYVLSGWALFQLLNLVFNRPIESYLAVIFFLCHPINGVAVNYKNATSFPFLILAVLLAITKYLRFLSGDNRTHNAIMSTACLILALFSHEVAVATPLYLFAVLVWGLGVTFTKALRAIIWPSLVVGVFIVVRSMVLSAGANVVGNIQEFQVNFLGYLNHFMQLISWYITRFFTADGIVLAWNVPINPQASILWAILLGFCILISGFIVFHSRIPRAYRLGIAWFVIGWLPVSLACFSRPFLGFVVQPHWLFFSSIGFFICMGHLLAQVPKKLCLILVLILGCIFILGSHRHNARWSSEHRYCSYWLGISPNNFWPNFWLGHDYLSRNELRHAQFFFERAAHTPYKKKVVLGNLGIIALKQEKFSLAEAYFHQVLRLDPRDAQTHYYLGKIYRQLRQYQLAKIYLNKSLELDRYLKSAAEELRLIPSKASVKSRGQNRPE